MNEQQKVACSRGKLYGHFFSIIVASGSFAWFVFYNFFFFSLFCQNENFYVANKDNFALLFNKNTYFSPFRFICKIYIFLKLRVLREMSITTNI